MKGDTADRSFEDLAARMAWRGTVVAAALNVLGMSLEFLLGSRIPGLAWWAPAASVAVSGVLLGWLVARRRTRSTRHASLVFVLNSLAVVAALWLTNRTYLAGDQAWPPFQSNKLGVLTAALLAPQPSAGLLSIGAYALSAVLQSYLLPHPLRARLPFGEPWVTVVYALFAVGLLLFRIRRLALEREVARVHVESAALRQTTRVFLAMRDLAQTPLQIIDFNTALLRTHSSPEMLPYIQRIQRALGRLRHASGLLSSYGAERRWETEDESFDPIAVLQSGNDEAAQSSKSEPPAEDVREADYQSVARRGLSRPLTRPPRRLRGWSRRSGRRRGPRGPTPA